MRLSYVYEVKFLCTYIHAYTLIDKCIHIYTRVQTYMYTHIHKHIFNSVKRRRYMLTILTTFKKISVEVTLGMCFRCFVLTHFHNVTIMYIFHKISQFSSTIAFLKRRSSPQKSQFL